MAYRTEIILVCDEQDSMYVPKLDSFLLDKCRVQLRNVSRAAGGRKRPESAVFMTVANYLPHDEFMQLVDALPFAAPQRVQLFLRTDKELLFSEYRFINDTITKSQENVQP